VSLQLQRRFRRDGGIESLNRTHAMARETGASLRGLTHLSASGMRNHIVGKP
jgi:hypothetical protein